MHQVIMCKGLKTSTHSPDVQVVVLTTDNIKDAISCKNALKDALKYTGARIWTIETQS